MHGIVHNLTLGVPIYNSARFLPDLFNCLQEQECLPGEILFLDDSSKDESAEMAKAFVRELEHPNVIFLQNPKNLGVSGTYNRILQTSTKQWVQILDADDYLSNDYYNHVSKHLQDQDACLITPMHTNNNFLNRIAKILCFWVPRYPPPWVPLLGSFATRSGVIYNKLFLQELAFNVPFFEGSDILHLLELRLRGPCRLCKAAYVYYTIHASALSRNNPLTPFLERLDRYAPFYRTVYAIDMLIRKKAFGFLRS